MAPFNLPNLLAIASLAVLACSYGATPVTALSLDPHANNRQFAHGHSALAKKRRSGLSKRCKTRAAPTASTTSTSAVHATSTSVKAATTTQAAVAVAATTSTKKSSTKAASTKASSSAKASSTTVSSSGWTGGKVGLAWPNGDDDSLKYYKTDKTSQCVVS